MNPKTLWKVTYGLYVVCSKKNKELNGQIANTIFQVTSEPPTIAVSIYKGNYTHEFIQESKVFTVSILSQDTPLKFIGHFGFKCGRDVNKLQDVKYKLGITGAPIILENSIGYLECEVIDSLDVNTHTIFVGRLVDADITDSKEPMTYDFYHKVKMGKAPKSAPTYIKEEDIKKTREVNRMAKYRCTVCGYIYDPQKGDPDSGIEPGTPFEEIPDDWVCPICGADKSAFEKVED